MHVHVAANVPLLYQLGKAVLQGGFEFAAVFAKLGRDPVHAERRVNLFLGCARHEGAVFNARESVLAQGVAALQVTLAQGDVSSSNR